MLLICISSIGALTTRERCLKVLKSFGDIPIILVADSEEGYSSVRYDNVGGLVKGIAHLILEEKRQCIGMITGYENNFDAQERLNVYKEVLAEYGLPIEDRKIQRAEINNRCVDAVEALIRNNPDLDAIVCANDAMASAVYQVLKKYNFEIGKDISVIGFDDIDSAKHMIPPLATVRADASMLGYRAVAEAHRKLLEGNVNVFETFYVGTEFIMRESAGINAINNKIEQGRTSETITLSEKCSLLIKMNHAMNIMSRDMLMLENSDKKNYDKILECLQDADINSCYLYMLNKPTGYYFGYNWEKPEIVYLRAYQNNNMVVVPKKSKQRVELDELYSHEFMPKERKTYVMIDLYSRELQYGFLLCDIKYRHFHYVEFLCYQVSIAIKLFDMFSVQEQLLLEKNDLVRKLKEENLQLDDISSKDELTGILNRRGFYQKAENYIKNPENYGKEIVLIYADLNYLKQINDRFGHTEGSFAINTCASALDVVLPNGIAGRIGGDEFAALTICDKGLEEQDFRERINKYLENVNFTEEKPYEITVSLGIWKSFLDERFELNRAIEMSDALLYEEKRKKPPFVTKND
jgi:diguanylate cyclase (GGDEF)-like protein